MNRATHPGGFIHFWPKYPKRRQLAPNCAWRFRWIRIDLSGRDGQAVRIAQALAEAVSRRVLVDLQVVPDDLQVVADALPAADRVDLLVVPVAPPVADRVVQGMAPRIAGQVDRDATTAMMPSAVQRAVLVVQRAVLVVQRAVQGDLSSDVRIAGQTGKAAGARDATLGTLGIAPAVPRRRSGLTDQGAEIDLR